MTSRVRSRFFSEVTTLRETKDPDVINRCIAAWADVACKFGMFPNYCDDWGCWEFYDVSDLDDTIVSIRQSVEYSNNEAIAHNARAEVFRRLDVDHPFVCGYHFGKTNGYSSTHIDGTSWYIPPWKDEYDHLTPDQYLDAMKPHFQRFPKSYPPLPIDVLLGNYAARNNFSAVVDRLGKGKLFNPVEDPVVDVLTYKYRLHLSDSDLVVSVDYPVYYDLEGIVAVLLKNKAQEDVARILRPNVSSLLLSNDFDSTVFDSWVSAHPSSPDRCPGSAVLEAFAEDGKVVATFKLTGVSPCLKSGPDDEALSIAFNSVKEVLS